MTKATALVCYALALAGSAALALRVFALGLQLPLPHLTLPVVSPWLIDLGWLGLFALQHSGMARATFKEFWLRIVPIRLERAIYAAVAGLLLIGMAGAWQPVPGEPWWSGPPWVSVVALAGATGMGLINLCYDHAGLFGLRQAWEETPGEDRLLITGPYRFVRHPLMAFLLVFLWGHAVMPPTLALLAGGLTLYIFFALRLEERDLLRRFGPAYAEYQRRVPALVPWRPPAPAATFLPATESTSCRQFVPGSSTPSAP